MEKILETLLSDPMYIGVAVLLAVLFVVSLLKQVVRVALLCLVGLVVLGLYLDATGKEDSADKIREAFVDKSSELSETLKDKITEGSEQAADVIRDAIEGEAADAAKKLADQAKEKAKDLSENVQEQAKEISEKVKEKLEKEKKD